MAEDIDNGTESRVRAGQTVRVVVLGAIAAVLAAWALANQDDVEVDWLFDTTTAPLVLVILVSAGLGVLLGLLIGRRRHR